MKKLWWLIVLVLVAGLAMGCRTSPDDESNEDVTGEDALGDSVTFPDNVEPLDLTGNERWVQPAGTAKITFFVDDRANQTFADGDMVWTGSWAWNAEDNTIVFNAAWGPEDGPYPLLYDDGPISEGGHEMEGAEAGDHIFSTEVYFQAEEEAEFSYGVLNELGFWMWDGPNGLVTIPAGSTDTVNGQGLTLPAFGDIDLKLTVDIGKLNPEFGYVEEWDGVNVYVKGSMNMWTPVQILDAGPDANKGDEAAEDGIYTFVQGLNLGKHTGLLAADQHAQFTFMFSKADETWEDASEYKLLTEGTQKGTKEGVRAYVSCDGGTTWTQTELLWEVDSWGSTENTTVIAKCDVVPPPPDCEVDEDCNEGEKCIEGECLVWCDLDEECGEGEKCIDNECKVWCDLDEECGEGEKCIDNECKVWCDLDEECGDGYECVDNQCQEIVVVSEPQINLVTPADGPVEGGTLVTLSGSDFLDGAQVQFEGVEATGVVVYSESKIECVTPAGAAGKADVTVTNPDGGTDTFINAFTYVDVAEAPVLDSIDPASGPVTGGTEVHLTGMNFLPGPTVLFGATIAASVTFVDATHVIATTPSGQLGAVSVTLINSDTQETTLADAFTYVPNVVDYCKLLAPTAISSYASTAAEPVYAEVWEPGLTPGEGAANGLQVQFGYGSAPTDLEGNPDAFTWAAATYHGESGNNDVWTATPVTEAPQLFAFTFRFSLDGTNWVYADVTGSGDGYADADLGTWEVMELGDGPAILSIEPKAVSVVGGETVTINGLNFDGELTLTVGGEVVDPVNVTEGQVLFTAPAHAVGPVAVSVENPDGKDSTKAEGLHYVLKLTPSLDGSLDEWPDAFLAATNTVESNWDPTANALDSLYVAFDDEYLYIAVVGLSEATNYVLGYVDVDFPQGTGPADMTTLSDNGGNGDLDDALSNVLDVTVDGFGADFAFGSKGMSSFVAGSPLGEAQDVGWRELADLGDFAWLDGSVIADEGIEAAIPLATLYPNGVPSGGKQVALFVKLSNGYGGFEGISNQTLPEWANDEAVHEVGGVVVLDVMQ